MKNLILFSDKTMFFLKFWASRKKRVFYSRTFVYFYNSTQNFKEMKHFKNKKMSKESKITKM